MVRKMLHVFCKIIFIERRRFMAGSLSNLVDNLSEVIYKLKSKDCDFFLNIKASKTT